ncbi:unnamed protein product, partial [Ascophyllum nodosum]
MVAVSAEPRGKDFFALKKAWAHSGRPRRCTATVQKLLEGEELLQSSRIPSSIVEVGDGVTRKWSFQDLASNTEAHVAKIIGGGCFAQVACTTLANGAKLAIKEMTNWHPTLQSHTEEYIAREIKMLEDCSVHPY